MRKPLPSHKTKRFPGRVVAIVPSAGSGSRLGLAAKKPFVRLGSIPLVIHALTTLEKCKSVDSILVAAEKGCVAKLRKLVRRFRLKKVAEVLVGGKTRMESVRNCLETVQDGFDIVLIHDGARPFIERRTVESAIRLARRFGGCIVAIPENDTVKLVDKKLFVNKTLDRNRIFRAQTPQVFRIDLLKKAFTKARNKSFTDDAGLVEALGGRIRVLVGSPRNIKITTGEDLKLAEVLL